MNEQFIHEVSMEESAKDVEKETKKKSSIRWPARHFLAVVTGWGGFFVVLHTP